MQDWYPPQDVLYNVTCKGYDTETKEDFTKESGWIRGTINGSNTTPDGKKSFMSSIAMQVPPAVVNRRYQVKVRDLDGNDIPTYNPLSPSGRINWTVSENANGEEEFDAGSLKVDKVDIFNKWGRFSHNFSESQPANVTETQSWLYDESTGDIKSTVNSVTHIGFYSQEESDNYELDVKFTSTAADNDRIGVVIAFKRDVNGREHTLTALRNNESNDTWSIWYNYMRKDQKKIADGAVSFVVKEMILLIALRPAVLKATTARSYNVPCCNPVSV